MQYDVKKDVTVIVEFELGEFLQLVDTLHIAQQEVFDKLPPSPPPYQQQALRQIKDLTDIAKRAQQ